MNLFSSHKSCLWQCIFFNPNFEQRTSVHTLKVAWKMEQEALRKAEKARTTRAADDLWNCEPSNVMFFFTKPFDRISELRNCVKAVTLRHFMTLWCPHIHFRTYFYNRLPTDLNSNLADFSPWPRPRRFRPRPRMSEKTPRPQRVPWSCDSCRLVPPNHA